MSEKNNENACQCSSQNKCWGRKILPYLAAFFIIMLLIEIFGNK